MRGNEEDPNKTVISQSPVGQHLSRLRSPGTLFIVFQGRTIPVASRITVGRDTDNTIAVDDALASRHHAAIQKIKDDYFIIDLDSTNGTFVNSQTVPPGKYVRLHPGDIIRIGRTELSLQPFQVP